MLPVGPLMVEHRLIERMIGQIEREAKRIRVTGKVDTDFILTAIEFIRIYADRCHHGKEEEILFRELKLKPLSSEHQRTLVEFEAEHAQGRKTVARIALVRERVLKGEPSAAKDLIYLLEELVRFYPPHIEKEDKDFFLPCMTYFTEEEQARMLEEGYAFDRNLVHTFYEGILDVRGGKSTAMGPMVEMHGADATPFGCMVCGYTFDPRLGDATQRVPPGTPFSQLSENWVCPHCHVGQRLFIAL
jgi:hemerythrin-like domain-containing protein/rubredoxin